MSADEIEEAIASSEEAVTEEAEEAEETEDIDGEEKPQAKTPRNIVFVTAEAAPYSKTGGLGDVCGSLPVVLASRGHRVMVVSPRYLNGTAADNKFANAIDLEHPIKVWCGEKEHEVSFFHEYRDGVDWVRLLQGLSIMHL